MLVEIFGLPGSGKTTLAKSFAAEGALLIPPSDRLGMVVESMLFAFFHPIRAFRLYFFILKHAPQEQWTLLLSNLFFAANAKYMWGRHVSRKGKVALIDQGYFQSLLSLFDVAPPDAVLRTLIHMLPKPDLLLVLEVPKKERSRRIGERGKPVRATAAEAVFPLALALFKTEGIPHLVVPGVLGTQLTALLTRHISYVTGARMPTEKAHGVSIAHMCAAFARAGRDVLLLVPRRRNPVTRDMFSFYGVARDFSLKRVPVVDFIGYGFTHPFFFFIQRALFMFSVSVRAVPPGVVYTREPEIAWKFSKSRFVVFEAHRWPGGIVGSLYARLVRGADLVVCNSHGTEEAAKRYGVARTLVAPNGFDPALFTETAQKTRSELTLPEGVLAIYAGSLGEGKGAEIAREAGAAVITGKNPTEVPAYLMSADILVLPNTRDGESERFTSPIKLFEYLAAGKAIIASDLPSIREILQEGDAVFVPPGNAEALREAIAALAKDAPRRKKLAARAKALSASYTWDARAERILEALTL